MTVELLVPAPFSIKSWNYNRHVHVIGTSKNDLNTTVLSCQRFLCSPLQRTSFEDLSDKDPEMQTMERSIDTWCIYSQFKKGRQPDCQDFLSANWFTLKDIICFQGKLLSIRSKVGKYIYIFISLTDVSIPLKRPCMRTWMITDER